MTAIRAFFCFQLLLLATHCLASNKVLFTFDTSYCLFRGGNYSKIHVVDLRTDNSSIGTVQRLAGIRQLVTALPLSAELKIFGNAITKTIRYKEAHTLLIMLHNLEIHGNASGDVSTLYFNAEYYLSTADTARYQYLFAIDTFIEKKNISITHDFSDYLFYTFNLAANAPVPSLKAATYTSDEAIGRLRGLTTCYSVFQTIQYRRGVYYTKEQFLNNTPGDTLFKEEDHFVSIGNSPHFYHLTERGRKGNMISTEDFYAVYNGDRWYKSTPQGNYGM
ncbi:MAG: hypothetical protein H0X33_01575 [Taibaiella sp.]|nr:hypothetical protein [Taibaiella sp.]